MKLPFEIIEPHLRTSSYEDPETGERREVPTPWSLRLTLVFSVPLAVPVDATKEEVEAEVEKRREMYEDMARKQILRVVEES